MFDKVLGTLLTFLQKLIHVSSKPPKLYLKPWVNIQWNELHGKQNHLRHFQ